MNKFVTLKVPQIYAVVIYPFVWHENCYNDICEEVWCWFHSVNL